MRFWLSGGSPARSCLAGVLSMHATWNGAAARASVEPWMIACSAASAAAPSQTSAPATVRPGQQIATTWPASATATTRSAGSQPGDAAVDAAGMFAAATALLAEGDARRAVDLLSDAVARQPDQIEYQIKLAEAYVAAGKRESAVRLLENTAQRDGAALPPRTALARLYREIGRCDAAIGLLSRIEPQLDAADVALLAECMNRAGRTSDAHAVVEGGLRRFPRDEPLWLALADLSLGSRRCAGVLDVVARARVQVGSTAGLSWRAAQAYFGLGQSLGEISTRRIDDGMVGQFHRDFLLIDRGRNPGEFICVPRESALFQVRRALDGGIDLPAAHLMHARIWQEAGKPRVAFEILKAREADMFDFESPPPPEGWSTETRSSSAGTSGSAADGKAGNPRSHGDPAASQPTGTRHRQPIDADLLDTYTRLAFDADALSDFVRLSRRRAEADPAHRDEILKSAYLALAEKYNQRGDEKMFVECLTRASDLSPKDIPLLLRRADAAWDADRRADAAACYRRVLESEPQHPRRKQMLERMAEGP